jgi:hypothetical protein
MSEPSRTEMKLPEGFQAGSIIAIPRADERAFPLRLSEFKILCEGANSGDRAGRDTCIGIFLSMLPTTISMYLAIDWANFWVQRRWGILVCLAVPILIAVGSLAGSIFYLVRMNKEDTPCSRLEGEIEEFFGPSETSPISAESTR